MPPIPGTDPGPFISGLEWLEGLGEVPLNVLRGNVGAAGRKLVDTLSSIPDAVLPGNIIPEVALPEDEVRASEVVGVDAATSPGLAKAIDIVGGTVANPATWLGYRGGTVKAGIPFTQGTEIPGARAALDRAKGALSAGYDKLPEGLRAVAGESAAGVRRAANWLDVPQAEEFMLRQAKASGNVAATAARKSFESIYAGMTTAEREAVGEIAQQINRAGTTDRSKWMVLNDADAYLAGRTDIRGNVVKDAVAKRQVVMDNILRESPEFGVMDIAMDTRKKNYMSRMFSGGYFDENSPLSFKRASQPDAVKSRAKELASPEDLLDFLQKQDVDLEFDALTADLGRAQQQATLVERGQLGRDLLKSRGVKLYDAEGQQAVRVYGEQAASKFAKETPFLYSNPDHANKVRETIQQIAKEPGMGDYAYKLDQAFNGMAPRSQNWFIQGLHKGNKLFKGAATYGVALPRIAFNVRNRTSALWQALSNPESRQTLGGNAKRLLSDLFGAFDDGLMKLTGSTSRKWGKSKLTSALDTIDEAFRTSGGSVQAVRKKLAAAEDGKFLVEALDNGVLNNFVDSEQLLSRMQANKVWGKTYDILEWPAEIAQGLEQRMRLGTFLDLRKNGVAKSGAEGAQTIRDTFLDYDVAGNANRTLRDVVPFASFLTQNTKQQAKFLTEQPAVAVAAAQTFGEDEGLPKYPWLDQQMTIPVGLDEKGNAQYLSGLGLPIEGLTQLPGLDGDDLYRDVIGALQPALKTAISYAADKDPLTGRAFGQYDKILGEPMGGVGRFYNIAKGTGLTQPVTGPIGQVENLLDARKAPLESALQATTGMKFTSVDADLAERQRLENFLRSQPDVKSAETLYQTEQTPETQAMLKQLREAKERLREKRAAAAAL